MDELLAQFRDVGVQDRSSLVQQFGAVLQIDPQTSQFFLESSNWNVEVAINTFLSTSGGQGNIFQQSAAVLPTAAFLTNLEQTHAMQFPPSTKLPMTWQFHNTGAAAWPPDASLVFVEGQRMGGPQQVPVHAGPGEVTELAVEVLTPAENGAYAGSWRLACSTGYFSDPIWLVVNVRDDAGADLTESLAAFRMNSQSPRPSADAASMSTVGPGQPVPSSATASTAVPAPMPMAAHQPQQQHAAGPGGGFTLPQPTFNFMQAPAGQPQPVVPAAAPAAPAVPAAPTAPVAPAAPAAGGFAMAQPAFNFMGGQGHPQQ